MKTALVICVLVVCIYSLLVWPVVHTVLLVRALRRIDRLIDDSHQVLDDTDVLMTGVDTVKTTIAEVVRQLRARGAPPPPRGSHRARVQIVQVDDSQGPSSPSAAPSTNPITMGRHARRDGT